MSTDPQSDELLGHVPEPTLEPHAWSEAPAAPDGVTAASPAILPAVLPAASERDLNMPLAPPSAPTAAEQFAPPDLASPQLPKPPPIPFGGTPPATSFTPPISAFGPVVSPPTTYQAFHPSSSPDSGSVVASGPLTPGAGSGAGSGSGRSSFRASWIGGVAFGSLIGAVVASLLAGAIYVASVRTSDTEQVAISAPSSSDPGTNTPSRAPVTIAGESLDIGDLLDKARPSVVTIRVDGGNFGAGAGSGIVIDEVGTILTNAHVISSAAGSSSAITVAFADGEVRAAVLVGSFPAQDVALVRTTEPKETIPAELGRSDDLSVGDDVIAIGNALNLGAQPSVTKGIVSALNRELSAEGVQLDRLIQTDAAINPGNSGGALLNAYGQVVGVNTAIIQNSQSLGFALSIDSIRPLIEDIEAGKGAVNGDSPFLGIETTNVGDQPADVLQQFEVTVSAGAFVTGIQNGTSAEIAGLQGGDVITDINGTTIETNDQVGEVIANLKPGDNLSISYIRSGDSRSVDVALGRRGG